VVVVVVMVVVVVVLCHRVEMGKACSHGGLPLLLDVVAVRVQEGQLGVVEDVVGAAEAVAGGADQQVTVMLPPLPPHGEVERRPAQLEASRQQRVAQDLGVVGWQEYYISNTQVAIIT